MGPSKAATKLERDWMTHMQFFVGGVECFVDTEDVPRLFGNSIGNAGGGYLRITFGRKSHLLHRFILGLSESDKVNVDHINGIRTDNRKCNLRLATDSQNAINCARRTDNTSGFRGVSWCKQRQRWFVQIAANNKRVTVGRFVSLEDAKEARLKAEAEMHGAFAYRLSRGGIDARGSN